MKKTLLVIILVTFSIGLYSQNFKVPKNYKLDKAEDYAPFENDVVQCCNWLIETPINEQPEKRKEANTFMLQWIIGSPTVLIEVNQDIATFMTSPELLLIFMGGWAKHSIDTKIYDDKIAGSIAGINSVIDFYLRNKKILGKDKHVEKYIKLKKKDKLEQYVKDNT